MASHIPIVSAAAFFDGDNQECDEGYGLFDLYDDGSFDYEYITYDWVVK